MRLIPRAMQRQVPWKNGRGLTTEIAVFPPDTDSWCARLSVAGVTEDGPFSSFPGVERFLLVVEGAGMALRGPAGEVELAGPLAAHRFDGGVPVSARLLNGPVRDANWMVRGPGGYAELVRGAARLDGEVVAALVLAGEYRVGAERAGPLDAVVGPGWLEGEGLLWVVGAR